MADSPHYPLVSAIMLVGRHNAADIQSAITCFQAQTYPEKELIIVNNTPSQFAASALLLPTSRDVMLVDTPFPYFAGQARNFGIATANGQLLAQFDADYWYAPNRLAAQIATLAENEATVVMLTKTLQYSFISGRASYQTNDRNALPSTMVFVRPRLIDYPNIDKQEELGILQKFQAAEAAVLAMPMPGLACKLYYGEKRCYKPVNCGLEADDFKTVQKLVRHRRNHENSPPPVDAVTVDQG